MNEKIEEKYNVIIDELKGSEKFEYPISGLYGICPSLIILEIFLLLTILSKSWQDANKYFMLISVIAVIIAFLLTVIVPLIFYSIKRQREYKDLLEERLAECNIESYVDEVKDINEKCKTCVAVKKGEAINSYNLYTYKQILQIEESLGKLDGEEREVYVYSNFREDGPGAGVEEADEIVAQNKKNGVKYYELFYRERKEVELESESGVTTTKDGAETMINLEKALGEEVHKFLDFNFYENARFDIMLYKENSHIIEGYYCLNFPLIKSCPYANNLCYMKCTEESNKTDNVFYKKMPTAISRDLYIKLNKFVKDILKQNV